VLAGRLERLEGIGRNVNKNKCLKIIEMSEQKIEFKPIKRKNVRQRKQSSDEEDVKREDEAEIRAKLELIHETKEKQKLRNRSNGVNA
jgi:hypothetical protein